jgi:6-phosphogluconolactonase
MRGLNGWLWLVCWGALAMAADAQVYRVYIGNYSRAPEGGIYQASFDTTTGVLSEPTVAGPATNASFLAIHPSGTRLYAVGEIGDFQGKKVGGVSGFTIDPTSGQLTLINEQSSGGPGPCHLSLDKAGTTAFVANYGGGSVASLAIAADGKLSPAASFIQHQGGSVNPQRQKEPHAHSINLDPANQFALVADLGLDQVLVYAYHAGQHTLTPHKTPFGKVAPGAGPRHLAFHPGGKTLYVINELDSTLTTFAWDAVAGTMSAVQTLSTLPADFTGNNSTAEVVVHPSGKFVYGSNRGHDTLAVFQVDASNGELKPVGHTPIGGKTPRNFVVDPTGKWVLIGCQGTNNVTVFSVDQQSGMLTATGQSLACPTPVCFRFLKM